MVNKVPTDEAALDAAFRALADPTRRAMLARLARGDLCVGELARPLAMSLPGASKHLRALEIAGLVRRERRGRQVLCRFDPTPLRDAEAWLNRHQAFWRERLDALGRYLDQESASWQNNRATPRSKSRAASARRASRSSRRGPRRAR